MKLVYRSQFKKDLKLAQRQNKDIEVLKRIIRLLVNGESLPAKFRDHKLSGRWKDHHECHIDPDWLLIYFIDQENDDLILERLGSHSELFK